MTVTFREVTPEDAAGLETIAQLHRELLPFGPMAKLGVGFLRDFCYRQLLNDGLLRATVAWVEDIPAGFVAWTDRSITFHRTAIKSHLLLVSALTVRAVLTDPAVVARLPRALRLMFDRRGEQRSWNDPSAEVLAIGVRREYARSRVGQRLSVGLIEHAATELVTEGFTEMRMLVDADNRAPLLLYHSLGAAFERYQQAGLPVTLVTLPLPLVLPGQSRTASMSGARGEGS